MRIGEIAIIGPDNDIKKRFIEAVCQEVELSNDQLTFGRLPIDDQIMLHLYGISMQKNNTKVSWDLLARKMLGYVVLFSWDNPQSFDLVKTTLDELTHRYESTLVVAADVHNGGFTAHRTLLQEGISITTEAKLIFCDVSKPESVKQVLLTLVNLLIDKTP
jgi:signal recognition particle receptor subunit beta